MTKRFSKLLLTIVALAMCQSAFARSQVGAQVGAQSGAQAGDLKHFAQKGLSFDYPAAIELEDRGNESGQHLILQSKGWAQIMIVSRYAQITTAEELSAARHEVVDTFIETMWLRIHEDDPNVSRTAVQIEVAGSPATGVRLRAVLNNEPGNAEIYSLQLGSRLIVLSLIGTDKEIAASAPAWLAVRRSLKIEGPATQRILERSAT